MDVVCIGEMLIDFICQDIEKNIEQGVNFSKKAGGAPANVATAVAKLGGSSAFVGKVGDDSFGRFLKNVLQNHKVNTDNMILDKNFKTSLAFVSLKNNGERDFEFIREPGADTMLQYDELKIEKIYSSKIIHFGSISLIKEPTKNTLKKILTEGKNRNIVISYDPNLRLNLWDSSKDAKNGIIEGLQFADIIKVSEEELQFITDNTNMESGITALHERGVKLVFVTKGKDGCLLSNGNKIFTAPGLTVKAVDTTGAGDGFTGGYLYKLSQLENILECTSKEEVLNDVILFANKVGAITTTKYGAISSLPYIEDIV